MCVEHDLVAITDEVYEHLTFDGVEHVPLATLPGMRDRTITISSAGKTFSFTGWKIGWACASPDLLAAVRTAKQFLTYVNGAPFQHAIVVGLGLPDAWFHDFAADLGARRDLLIEGLSAAGFTVFEPHGTYFVTTDAAPARCDRRSRVLSGAARALRRGRRPELGLLRRRRRGPHAGALHVLQAARGPRRGGRPPCRPRLTDSDARSARPGVHDVCENAGQGRSATSMMRSVWAFCS